MFYKNQTIQNFPQYVIHLDNLIPTNGSNFTRLHIKLDQATAPKQHWNQYIKWEKHYTSNKTI